MDLDVYCAHGYNYYFIYAFFPNMFSEKGIGLIIEHINKTEGSSWNIKVKISVNVSAKRA